MDLDISEDKRIQIHYFIKTLSNRSELAYTLELVDLKLTEIENKNNGFNYEHVGLSTLSENNCSAFGEEGVRLRYSEESPTVPIPDLHMANPPSVSDPVPTVIKKVPVSNGTDIKNTNDRAVKTVSCKVCKRSFSDRRHLIRHEQTHLADKVHKHSCELCGKQYSRSDNLKKHMKSLHSGGNFIACSYCSRQFRHESTLKSHMEQCDKQNCEEKDLGNQSVYKCDVCQKSFWNEQYLKRHKRLHAKPGDKPFQCSKCGKQFTYSASKNKHDLKCEVTQSGNLSPRHGVLERPLLLREQSPNQRQHQQQSQPVYNGLNPEDREQEVSDSNELIGSQQGALTDNQFSTQEGTFDYNDNMSFYQSGNVASGQYFNLAYEDMVHGQYAPDYYNSTMYMSAHYPYEVSGWGGEGFQ